MAAAAPRIQHKDGKVGGYLVGRRHSQGGIKAKNISSAEPLELESDEVIITRRAVLSPQKHDFNGKEMTNLEILSAINEQGGGVSLLEQGGKMGSRYACRCSGRKHSYQGEEMTDREILAKMEQGGQVMENIPQYAPELFQGSGAGSHAGALAMELSQRLEKMGFHPEMDRTNFESGFYSFRVRVFDDAGNGYLFWTSDAATANEPFPSDGMDVFPVNAQNIGAQLRSFVARIALHDGQPKHMEQGGHTCGCQHAERIQLPHHLLPDHHPDEYKDGGKIPTRTRKQKPPVSEGGYFKGTDYSYHNPYELNRAIEALLDSRPDGDFDAAEQRFLKYYSGYGGLEKYGAEGVGLLYEYYTPTEIARRMWGLAYKYGYQGGAVLEPSCGTGEFFNYAPDDARKTGYETNPYSARICRILHPTVQLETRHFEEVFIKNRDTIRNRIDGLPKFSLVIGNPPYGNFQGKFAGMGEKSYTRASNYIDYFIFRGLDLLLPGGLLIYIIGAEVAAGGIPFLAQKSNPIKKEIAEKALLLDAYRLPNGVFDRTDVLPDIIVLQKM